MGTLSKIIEDRRKEGDLEGTYGEKGHLQRGDSLFGRTDLKHQREAGRKWRNISKLLRENEHWMGTMNVGLLSFRNERKINISHK